MTTRPSGTSSTLAPGAQSSSLTPATPILSPCRSSIRCTPLESPRWSRRGAPAMRGWWRRLCRRSMQPHLRDMHTRGRCKGFCTGREWWEIKRNKYKALLFHHFAANGGNMQSKMALAYTSKRHTVRAAILKYVIWNSNLTYIKIL